MGIISGQAGTVNHDETAHDIFTLGRMWKTNGQIMEYNFWDFVFNSTARASYVLATWLVIKDTKIPPYSYLRSSYLFLEEVRNGKKGCN